MIGPGRMFITRIDEDQVKSDPQVRDAMRQVAGEIAAEANRTSAEIGITYRDRPDNAVVIGPRGAAAVPTEVGTRRMGAKRYVKRVLDRRRR